MSTRSLTSRPGCSKTSFRMALPFASIVQLRRSKRMVMFLPVSSLGLAIGCRWMWRHHWSGDPAPPCSRQRYALPCRPCDRARPIVPCVDRSDGNTIVDAIELRLQPTMRLRKRGVSCGPGATRVMFDTCACLLRQLAEHAIVKGPSGTPRRCVGHSKGQGTREIPIIVDGGADRGRLNRNNPRSPHPDRSSDSSTPARGSRSAHNCRSSSCRWLRT